MPPESKSPLALAREAVELAEKATKGPWCIDSVGEKVNDYIVGVAYAAADEECERPLSGWLPALSEDESEHPLCDEKVCEIDNASNAEFIAHAGTSYATVARAAIEMAEMLKRARREHRTWGDDGVGPCEKIERGWDTHACTCGADDWNARIDALTKGEQ